MSGLRRNMVACSKLSWPQGPLLKCVFGSWALEAWPFQPARWPSPRWAQPRRTHWGRHRAEAERYLPTLVERLEAVTDKVGLGQAGKGPCTVGSTNLARCTSSVPLEQRQEDIVIRMTGCPNSCGRRCGALKFQLDSRVRGSRPSMAEIGFIGKALSRCT